MADRQGGADDARPGPAQRAAESVASNARNAMGSAAAERLRGEAGVLPPFQAFEDNMRPAQLMLKVYRLLDSSDQLVSSGALVDGLRELLRAEPGEDLLLIQNTVFLGLVRERADVHRPDLRTAALCNLLRQAVVASCTALDAFIPAMLRAHLPELIRLRGREFFPADPEVREYFKDVQFSIDDVLRTRDEPFESTALAVALKMVHLVGFKHVANSRGIAVAGAVLGLAKPWEQIAARLGDAPESVRKAVDFVVSRRHDIVHRADRHARQPDGEPQAITFAQAKKGVDTIYNVCTALHELVNERLGELRAGAG